MIPIDHRETNLQIAGDIETLLATRGEDIVDILLFRAGIGEPETVADPEVPDVVGSIESGQRALQYDDPVETKAKILPFDMPILATLDGADPLDSSMENPVVMLIGEKEVPVHSVVQYEEYVNASEVRRVSLCVIQSETFGRSPVIGMKHYLIPFPEDEGVLPDFIQSPDDGGEESGE